MIGEKLNDLRKERNEADYDGLQNFKQERAKKAIETAKVILELLDETNS